MDLQKVGKFIAERRKLKKLTQDKLGEKIGVNGKTISKWERGVNAPDISVLNKLSEILDVNVSELLDGCKIDDKQKTEEHNPVKSIEYYTKRTKIKYIKVCCYVFFITIALFAILFTVNNYNKSRIYSIKSGSKNYYVEGYMIYNPNQNLTIIRNIDIYDNLLGTGNEIKIKSIKVSIICENKNLYSIFYENSENEETLNSFLLNKTYFVKEDLKSKENILTEGIKLNKLNLEIKYVSNNDKEETILIPLKTVEEYTNNKIIY